MTHTSGLRGIFASARGRDATILINPNSLTSIVRELRGLGKPVVLDLGSGMNSVYTSVQNEIDSLIVVTDPIPLTLRMTRALLHDLEANRPTGSQLHVVVVTRAASSNPLSWHEIEKVLGREIRAVISLAAELALQAQNANVPIVMFQPTAIVSSQMIKLADDVGVRMRSSAGEAAN
ncbi:MAG: hypothetical protein HC828_14255 [Blastochloris sp.]|nr:hypothetical protein [Blastochloris sp.]